MNCRGERLCVHECECVSVCVKSKGIRTFVGDYWNVNNPAILRLELTVWLPVHSTVKISLFYADYPQKLNLSR